MEEERLDGERCDRRDQPERVRHQDRGHRRPERTGADPHDRTRVAARRENAEVHALQRQRHAGKRKDTDHVLGAVPLRSEHDRRELGSEDGETGQRRKRDRREDLVDPVEGSQDTGRLVLHPGERREHDLLDRARDPVERQVDERLRDGEPAERRRAEEPADHEALHRLRELEQEKRPEERPAVCELLSKRSAREHQLRPPVRLEPDRHERARAVCDLTADDRPRSDASEGERDRYRGADEVADDVPYLERPELHGADQQCVRHGRERGEEEADARTRRTSAGATARRRSMQAATRARCRGT